MASYAIPLASVFLVLLAILAIAGWLPAWILGLYLLASAAAFVAYALDKSAARNDRWRIRENTLQVLALLGGWPGALLGQQLLRHKSSKTSFQMVFWLMVLLNCVVLSWLVL